ncbi:MAG TPA: CrcB family protein [Steroidobacteraceae bacterium]|nr:CrcB family protein [Steroidobacteraceae bacterium]
MPAHGFAAVGSGAAAGAWLRWALGIYLNPVFPTVPLGTVSANLLGGLIIGAVMTAAAEPLHFPPYPAVAAGHRLSRRTHHLLHLLGRDRDTAAAAALWLGRPRPLPCTCWARCR